MTPAELAARARDIDIFFGIDLAFGEPAIGYTILEGDFIVVGDVWQRPGVVRGPSHDPRHRHHFRALASMERT